MKYSYGLLLAVVMLSSCSKSVPESLDPIGNGVYYWKTVFSLNESDSLFLEQHAIDRLYLRLFDVDKDPETNNAVPIATLQFAEPVPQDVEIVPVVYLTTNLQYEDWCCDSVCYERIKAMAKKNGFENFRELQLDCDWPESNSSWYFMFCRRMTERAHAEGRKVSATIRLHQLKSEAPPVDRGVLMLYNTGSLYRANTTNSILSTSDVAPYLTSDIAYSIPLSCSYPTYGWGIVMRDSKFAAILHQTDFSTPELYRRISANIVEVIKEHALEDKTLLPGDQIRIETSEIETILEVKRMVEKRLPNVCSNLLYHLDSQNLSNYSFDEINAILTNNHQ